MIYLLTLNWDTSDMLIRMYESAVSLAEKPFNLVIVDNGSVKSEYDKLLNYSFKNCTIIRNEKNLGFAAGNNIGLKAIKEENVSIIFINSDIIIKEKFWDTKFEAVLNHENVGVCGCAYFPLVWTKDGKFRILPIPENAVESESVQGAFFGVKKEILNKVGNFDENFKMAQYDETDLCFTIRELGMKCIYFKLQHDHDHHHSSTKKHGYYLNDEIKNINDFKANTERNRQLLIEKHFK